MQIFVNSITSTTLALHVQATDTTDHVKRLIHHRDGVPPHLQRLVFKGRPFGDDARRQHRGHSTTTPRPPATLADYRVRNGDTLHLALRLRGGIDFQHREGSKFGGGGVMSESQAAADRKERLRKLALETVDLDKDPYFLKNHLGTFECKLCLTLHTTEGNYLAHTQGKRHQQNLARRAAREEKLGLANNATIATTAPSATANAPPIKIGRPGYKVTKARDPNTKQRTLAFEIDYPESEPGAQPRHRFMSTFEQRVEPPDKAYQYLLFACEPYETIAFKIPNEPLDKSEGAFFTNWDASERKFTLQLSLADPAEAAAALKRATDAAVRGGAPKRRVLATDAAVLH